MRLDGGMAANAVELPVDSTRSRRSANQTACRRFHRGRACRPRPARSARAAASAPSEGAALMAKQFDSSRSLGMAAVLMATNGPSATGRCLCSARATSSLPEPDSPVMSTVTTLWLSGRWRGTHPAWRAPAQHRVAVWRSSVTSSRWLSSTARRISSTALGKSNGLGRYSNAPRWKAETALSRIGIRRHDDDGQPAASRRTFFQQLQARAAGGMRMSLTSTWGPFDLGHRPSHRPGASAHLARGG